MTKKPTLAAAEAEAAAIMAAKSTAKTAPTGAVVKERPTSAAYLNPKFIKRRPGHNPRFDFGEIEDLARSIRVQATEHGVPGGLLMPIRVERITPVLGTNSTGAQVFEFELIDGDRRLTAVEWLMARWYEGGDQVNGYNFPDGIAATIVPKGQSEVTSLLQMFEANTGKPFLPLEEAAAYKRMRDAGMTIEKICAAVQRRHVHVVATLALVDASPELKEAVAKGEIGGTMAKDIAVAARGDAALQAELTQDAKKAGKGGKVDKDALQAVKAKIHTARANKAAKKGKTIKAKVLAGEQISKAGDKAAKHLVTLLKEIGGDFVAEEADLAALFSKDEKMAAAYTFGVLNALKFAAGVKNIPLEI